MRNIYDELLAVDSTTVHIGALHSKAVTQIQFMELKEKTFSKHNQLDYTLISRLNTARFKVDQKRDEKKILIIYEHVPISR